MDFAREFLYGFEYIESNKNPAVVEIIESRTDKEEW